MKIKTGNSKFEIANIELMVINFCVLYFTNFAAG